MTIVEVGLPVVAEERAVIDINALDLLQTIHVLERHVDLFELREEVWT